MRRLALRIVPALLLTALLTIPAFAQDAVIGTLDRAPKPVGTEHPWYAQCQLGSVCADAFRACAGTQIALVNTGDLDDNLFQGEVTMQEICGVLPYDRALATATITPQQLCQLLEQSVSRVTLDPSTERVDEAASAYDGFCQISGFTLRYDASAPLGERVLDVTLSDGTKLSRDDAAMQLTLCASRYLLDGGYGFPVTESVPLSFTQAEALADYVSAHRDLPEDDQKRIVVVGARQAEILGIAPKEMILVCCLLLFVPLVGVQTKMRRYRDEYGNVSNKF